MKFSALILFVFCVHSVLSKLEQKYRWKEVEFAWPSEDDRKDALNSGRYKPENNLPLGLDVWRDKLFITIPRWKTGVASSLNYIKITDEKSPVFIPYPNWKANTIKPDAIDTFKLNDNGTIISPLRIRIDECDRLWVMDTGIYDIYGSSTQIAPPALVIFDLNTDTLIKRYPLPQTDIKDNPFYPNVIVDIRKNHCEDAYAYIPEMRGNNLVVYSLKSDRSWRTKHSYFHFDPLSTDYNVGGINFQWMGGIIGMAMGKLANDRSRTVYFHPFSSSREFSVSNIVLQNKTRAISVEAFHDFKFVGDRGERGQSTTEFIDEKTNVLLYTQVNKNAVGCWNINRPYTPENQGIIDMDDDSLVFPNDLKVDRDGNLWVLSDRMPLFSHDQLNPNEYNYRILKGKVSDLIDNTPCLHE